MTGSLENIRAGFFRENPGLFVIVAAYIALPFLLSPVLEAAIIDDWAYKLVVERLVDTGELRLSDWGEPSFIFQAYFGALFTVIFGHSFTVLRVSTIILSLFGSLAFYKLLKRFGAGEFLATSAVLLLLFNPLYFDYLYTFMTDVPYISLALISFFFYLKGFDSKKRFWLFVASLIAACAFLTRQLGIFIPIGVVFFMLANRREHKAGDYLAALAPVVVVFFGYMAWFTSGGSTWAQRNVSMQGSFAQFADPASFVVELFQRALWIIEYAGLFSLPLALVYYLTLRKSGSGESRRFIALAFLFWALVVFIATFAFDARMPFLIGSLMHYQVSVSENFWLFLTLLSSVGAVGLMALLTEKGRSLMRGNGGVGGFISSPAIMLLVYFVLQAALALSHTHLMDKYVFAWLPFIMILIVVILKGREVGKASRALLVAAIIFSGFYSLGNTSPHLNALKAEWKMADWLMERGIPKEEIFMNFEWNGYYNYEPVMAELLVSKPEDTVSQRESFAVMRKRAKFAIRYTEPRFKVNSVEVPMPFASRALSLILFWRDPGESGYIHIAARTREDQLRVLGARSSF